MSCTLDCSFRDLRASKWFNIVVEPITRLQSDNCLLSFQDSNSPIQNGWQKDEDGRQLLSLCLIHPYRPVDVLSDVQSQYVNVARDDDMYTCMFLCGQTHIMNSEKKC